MVYAARRRSAGWREAMRTLALKIRDPLLAHPWVPVPVVGAPVADIGRDLIIHEAILCSRVDLAKKNGTIVEKLVTANELAIGCGSLKTRSTSYAGKEFLKIAAWFAGSSKLTVLSVL